jgi:hypothetical protein
MLLKTLGEIHHFDSGSHEDTTNKVNTMSKAKIADMPNTDGTLKHICNNRS